MFRRTFTSEEEDAIQALANIQHKKGHRIPWTERWKRHEGFSPTVSCLNSTVTYGDVIVTLWVPGHPPVNMVIDKYYNTLYSIHIKLCALLGDEFGCVVVEESGRKVLKPPLSEFEYSCYVLVKGGGGGEATFKRDKMLLEPGSWCDWLLNGHIIHVRKSEVR